MIWQSIRWGRPELWLLGPVPVVPVRLTFKVKPTQMFCFSPRSAGEVGILGRMWVLQSWSPGGPPVTVRRWPSPWAAAAVQAERPVGRIRVGAFCPSHQRACGALFIVSGKSEDTQCPHSTSRWWISLSSSDSLMTFLHKCFPFLMSCLGRPSSVPPSSSF